MFVKFRFKPFSLIYAVVFGTPLLFTITYLMAASEGHVEWCIPPIGGCVSITDTGIYPPESYVFRFGAYPLMTFMALLFYFFREWLEIVAGEKPLGAQIAWYLALVACLCMNVALAVMQGKAETAYTIHAVFAISYFVLMLASQALYTYEDFHWRQLESKTALSIRVGTIFLQLGLLLSIPLLWLFGIKPNQRDIRYEWLIVLTFFLWYSSFLFERDTVFTEKFRPRQGPGQKRA